MTEETQDSIKDGAGCKVCPKCGAELNILIELKTAGTQPSILTSKGEKQEE